MESQRHSFQVRSSVLNKHDLQHCGKNYNEQEHEVVEEVAEHIYLGGVELPGVDLVEYLQEYKHVEEQSESFRYPRCLLAGGAPEEQIAFEEHEPQQKYLEYALNDYIP